MPTHKRKLGTHTRVIAMQRQKDQPYEAALALREGMWATYEAPSLSTSGKKKQKKKTLSPMFTSVTIMTHLWTSKLLFLSLIYVLFPMCQALLWGASCPQ